MKRYYIRCDRLISNRFDVEDSFVQCNAVCKMMRKSEYSVRPYPEWNDKKWQLWTTLSLTKAREIRDKFRKLYNEPFEMYFVGTNEKVEVKGVFMEEVMS